MKKNSVELRDSIHQMVLKCRSMVETAKKEKRNLTDEEEKEFDELKEQIEEKKRELNDLEEELKTYELPEDLDDKEEKSDNENPNEENPDENPDEEPKEEKNNRNKMKKQFYLTRQIRNAMANNQRSIHINAETRAMQVTGDTGVHDSVVETEVQGILEPLYAKSVLAQLGVKFYTGLPQGDIQVPIMGKGNVGWADEIAAAAKSENTFTTVKLTPKRLTAYVDVSKQLIAQDTIGVENAIRADIVNALTDKLEATVLGDAAKTDNQPAGIFNGQTATTADTFAKLTKLEATVEHSNVYGDMKYLLSTGAKADLRAMAKSTKNTQLVMEGGEIDGVPAITTSNVADNKFIYGDFSNLAIGSWGDIDITIDEYSQAVNGCVRLVVNAYFDAAILRKEAFAFGQTEATA